LVRLHKIQGAATLIYTQYSKTELHWGHPGKHTHLQAHKSQVNSHQQPATSKESMSHTQTCHSTLPFVHSNGLQQGTLNISFTAIWFTSSLILALGALSMWQFSFLRNWHF